MKSQPKANSRKDLIWGLPTSEVTRTSVKKVLVYSEIDDDDMTERVLTQILIQS